jgi:hypothetical protein
LYRSAEQYSAASRVGSTRRCVPRTAAWDTTNHLAERNSPLQNTFLSEDILLCNNSVACLLINITLPKSVENLFITLLITHLPAVDKISALFFHSPKASHPQVFQQ